MQGTQIYSYYNNLPAEMMDHAIANSIMLPPDPMVYAAIYAEGWGANAGIYLLYGFRMQIISGVFIGIAALYSGYQFYSYWKSYKNLGLSGFGRGQTKENFAREIELERDGQAGGSSN